MTREERAVLAANEAFYAAFAAHDAEAMDALWAKRAPVVCLHPGWQPLRGRDAVVASWRAILDGPNAPLIACRGATAHVLGDAAFVVCTERLPGVELVATNVFVLEDAEWRLVHHHASAFDTPSDEDGEEPPPGLLH